MQDKRNIGSIKNLGDGRYRLRVSSGFDEYGRRIQLSRTVDVTSDRAAEAALMQFYNETRKAAEQRTANAPTTLAGLYREFKENYMALNLKPTTIDFYNSLWESHIKEFGNARLKTFNHKSILGILKECKDKPRTQKGVYGLLRVMFSVAVTEWKYMAENPCETVKPPKYKAPEKKMYDDKQLATILNRIEGEEPLYRAMFYFALLCGMRRGEIMGLRWDDIDLRKNEVSIRQAAASAISQGTYYSDPKTQKSIRKLAMPTILNPILKALRAQQTLQKMRLTERWKDTPWVFKGWDGGPLTVDIPTRWWKRFLKTNPDIPTLNFHGLRHMAATLLIQQNVPISTVSGILGHAQIGTTVNIYSHVIEDTKKGALALLENSVLNIKNKENA